MTSSAIGTADQDFGAALKQAWTEHAADPAAVAGRLGELIGKASSQGDLANAAALVVHLHGEHLGTPAAGAALVERMLASPFYQSPSGEAAALQRARAILALAAQQPGADEAIAFACAAEPVQSRAAQLTRVFAPAAEALCARGEFARAAAAWAQALAAADALPAQPSQAARTLAISANNIACTLAEATAPRAAADTALMLAAAGAARRWWAVAGGQVQVGRAEYCLAICHLAAGQAERALTHARDALAAAQGEGSLPADRAYAHVAIARAALRAGAEAQVVDASRSAAVTLVPMLIPAMQRAVQAELTRLEAERAQRR